MMLGQAIESVVSDRLAGVHTCIPGRIEAYDPASAKADVKPLIQVVDEAGTSRPLPVVPAVPVLFPRSAAGSLTFPIARGDLGLLLFAERSMEVWLAKGGDALPGDPRRHDLSDGIFLPGLYPFNSPSPAEDGALVLRLGEVRLKLKAKKLAIGNDSQELLDIIDQLLDALIASVVPTAIGPQQLSKVTDGTILQLKTDLDEIKGTL